MEIRLPYFVDIYKMWKIAQPFAILANVVLTAVYLAVYLGLYAVFAAVFLFAAVVCFPFIVLAEFLEWLYVEIRKMLGKYY